MLKNKITAAALAASMLVCGAPYKGVLADGKAADTAAVSGYVSTSGGAFTLAGESTSAKIYVDSADFEGVIRAAGDLAGDIKTVTGKDSVMVTDSITSPVSDKSGIVIEDNSMKVMLDTASAQQGRCFAAAYNNDGTLAAVKISETAAVSDSGTVYSFDSVLEKPDGGKIRAFVWDDNMNPITAPLGMAVSETADTSKASVIIGTLGQSDAVDALALEGKIDVSEIEGKWESFTIQQADNSVVIAGSDKRGTIYGIYDLCEKIGVSPWHFWADVQTGHADNLYINLPDGGYTEGEPSVQYRGIFLNDEFNMTEWSKSMSADGSNMGNEVYEKIFELLLRLKANYLWPAMHTYSTAFNVTEGNAALADRYGIVMGSSHGEPILRNNLGELYTYQQQWISENPDKTLYINTTDDAKNSVAWMWTDKDNDGNAVANKEFLTDYWKARAQANGGYENTYTLGMRGVHDGQFSTNMDGMTALKEIIAAQTKILTDEAAKSGKDISDVPQVFIPYKEMLDYYNKGLDIPDYVTLMWTDDNFGYIRQLSTDAERERSGGAGIYYHLSYFGRPRSYLWLGSTQPGLIREEMTKAYDMGAKKIWVANVGDLKPAETELEYFLDLARDVDSVRNTDIGDWLKTNAKRDFGFTDAQAAEYADIKLSYYELANARRPEHMQNGLYSLADFGDEGQILLDRCAALEERAQMLYSSLSEEKQPSFYELELYPLMSMYNTAKKYIMSDKASYYAENGYGSAANRYAAESDAAYQDIVDDTSAYTSMLGGKWNKMMNPFQTKLNGSFGGTISGKLTNPTVSELPYTKMTIAPEGGKTLSLSNASPRARFIDIINSGTGSFEWRASTECEWIRLNKTSGTVFDNDRIYVGIDESKLPDGVSEGSIVFERVIGDTAVQTQTVKTVISTVDIPDAPKTYVEADGYVSIEAEHYTNSVTNGVYEWKTEKDFGRSGDSVKIYPNLADKVTTPNKENSAYLEYDVYFTSAGTFDIDVYRMPTLNELGSATLRCHIGIDDAAPVKFGGNTKTANNSTGADAWGKGVLCNSDVMSGKITVPTAGMHKVRLYNEDSGVVIDKFVITTGEKKASYYGAPESYNTTYNIISASLPTASEPAEKQTGDITALFEPSMLIANITDTSADIVKLSSNDNDAVFAAAAYDADGNMLDFTYTMLSAADTPEGGRQTVLYTKPSADGAAEIQYMLISAARLETESVYVPIAPSVTVQCDSASLAASYDSGMVYPAANMKEYTGKESVCVITEKDASDLGSVRYIRQNTVSENTYEKIPFGGEGKFDLIIGISGVSDIIRETLSTIINITPDTAAQPASELYGWNFETDQTGTGSNVPVLGGNAVYDSANKAVKLTSTGASGGKLTVDFDKPITAAHGEKITVSTKIAYGKLTGKYTKYTISDSAGKELISSNISAYATGTQTIKIGDDTVYTTDSGLISAIVRANSALSAGYTTYTAEIEPAANKITLIISSTGGTVTYEGKLPSGTSYDIKNITVSTSYNNVDRGCYVDDISVSKSKAQSYTMTFAPTDSESGEIIENAQITLSDKVTGAVITAESDGTYKLCEGIYAYKVTADGYAEATGVLELTPAAESKTVTVKMSH